MSTLSDLYQRYGQPIAQAAGTFARSAANSVFQPAVAGGGDDVSGQMPNLQAAHQAQATAVPAFNSQGNTGTLDKVASFAGSAAPYFVNPVAAASATLGNQYGNYSSGTGLADNAGSALRDTGMAAVNLIPGFQPEFAALNPFARAAARVGVAGGENIVRGQAQSLLGTGQLNPSQIPLDFAVGGGLHAVTHPGETAAGVGYAARPVANGAATYAETVANQKNYQNALSKFNAPLEEQPVTANGQQVFHNGQPMTKAVDTIQATVPVDAGHQMLMNDRYTPNVNPTGSLDGPTISLHADPQTGEIRRWNTNDPAYYQHVSEASQAPKVTPYSPSSNDEIAAVERQRGAPADLSQPYSMQGAQARTRPVENPFPAGDPRAQLVDTYNGAAANPKAAIAGPENSIDRTQLTGKQLSIPSRELQASRTLPEVLTSAASERPVSPEARLDQDSLDRAQMAAGVDKKGVGGMSDSLKKTYQDWVNSSKHDTLAFEGQKVKQQFSPLDEYAKRIEGPNTPAGSQMLRFQSGRPADATEAAQFQQLKGYFDQKYGQLTEAGVPVKYQENYLKQIWSDDPKAIDEKVDRALSLNPSLTKEKVIANYQEGIAAGLTPKYDKLSDIAAAYEREANRAIADTQFFKNGMEQGVFSPKRVPGFEELRHFPEQNIRYEQNGQMVEHSGPVYAPSELAKAVNNFQSQGTLLRGAAEFAGALKNTVLTGGVPGTSWNFHGITTAGRDLLAAGNPLKVVRNAITDVAAMTYNPLNKAYVAKNLDSITDLLHSGLTLSTEGPAFSEVAASQGKLKAGVQAVRGAFEKPLFEGFIPATKSRFAIEAMDNMLKKGIPREEALKAAAHSANTIFGGNNLAELGTNKDFMNVVRTFFLAPDTYISLTKTAKGVAKAITEPSNPEYWAFRSVAMNTAATYLAMNVANKASTGHWMFQNAAGHTFEIQHGYDKDGNPRYIRPLGQALDFVKLPVDAVSAIAGGDLNQVARIAQNRLSPLISQAVQIATNTDPFGRSITKPKDTPAQKLEKFAANATGSFVPQPVSSAARFAAGQQNGEQALASALELPVRYGNAASTKPLQDTQQYLQAQGQTGDQIGQALASQKQATADHAAGLTQVKNGQPTGQAAATSQATDASGKPLTTGVQKLKDGSFAYKDSSGNVQTSPNEQKATLAWAKDQVANGAQDSVRIGDKLVTQDQNGNVVIKSVSQMKKSTADAQYALDAERAKSAGDHQAWLKATDSQITYLKQQLGTLSPQTDMSKILQLEAKIDSLTNQGNKVLGQGGFTKSGRVKSRVGGRGAGGTKVARGAKVSVSKVASASAGRGASVKTKRASRPRKFSVRRYA